MTNSRLTLLIAGLAGFVLQTACMSYKQIEPADVVDYGEIRVTMTNEREEFLWEPSLRADTLIGLRGSGYMLRVPLVDVEEINAGQFDALKTVLALVAVPAVLGLAIIVSYAAED